MPPRILVPFDDSEPAREALAYALELFPDGEFVVVTVADTTSVPYIPNTADDADTAHDPEELLDDAIDQLAAAEAIADEHGVDIDIRTRTGTPAQEILAVAERDAIDHVVIGSHGRSGVARLLLGSVAEVVVRHSSVPVTVVR
ncbi:universal stress protein [Natrinema sp. HArc-T2]|uniref:universal stress protein n=1 Tax=Natrinema sp. HArc-T2 TaxID=3242701 RepID=UPI00359EB9B4